MDDGLRNRTIVMEEDPDFLKDLSEYLDVLSSSTRLRILKSIERTPKDVREISAEIETSYENTKKHLDKLLRIGVIRKEAGFGKMTSKGVHPVWKYSLVAGGLEGIIRNLGLFSNIRITLTDTDLATRLEAVKGRVSDELRGNVAVLMLLGGDADGEVFPLEGDEVRIGRADSVAGDTCDPDRDIVLPEQYGAVTRISRPHAVLKRQEGAWIIEDCGSTGGTTVNGTPLIPRIPVTLANGDLIELAKGVKGARLVYTTPKDGT